MLWIIRHNEYPYHFLCYYDYLGSITVVYHHLTTDWIILRSEIYQYTCHHHYKNQTRNTHNLFNIFSRIYFHNIISCLINYFTLYEKHKSFDPYRSHIILLISYILNYFTNSHKWTIQYNTPNNLDIGLFLYKYQNGNCPHRSAP